MRTVPLILIMAVLAAAIVWGFWCHYMFFHLYLWR